MSNGYVLSYFGKSFFVNVNHIQIILPRCSIVWYSPSYDVF